MSKGLEKSLEELAVAEDVESALASLAAVDATVSTSLANLLRFNEKNTVRLAASLLAKYDAGAATELAVIIAPDPNWSEKLAEYTTVEQRQSVRQAIESGMRFLQNDSVAAAVNGFYMRWHTSPLNRWAWGGSEFSRSSLNPLSNLVSYATLPLLGAREAIQQLVQTYAKEPEVLAEAFSKRLKEFPQFVQQLTTEKVTEIIKRQAQEARPFLVSSLLRDDLPGFSFAHPLDAQVEHPDSEFGMSNLRMRSQSLEDACDNVADLSQFLSASEPLVAAYAGHEDKLRELAYKVWEAGNEKELVGSREVAFNKLIEVVSASPSIKVGIEIANIGLYTLSSERKGGIENLIDALRKPAISKAVMEISDAADKSDGRYPALRGLASVAYRYDSLIAEKVAAVLATSSYNYNEAELFFKLIKTNIRHVKGLRALTREVAPLREKIKALQEYIALKTARVGVKDPSVSPAWREDAARTTRQFLYRQANTGTESVDDTTTQDIEHMTLDELISFVTVVGRENTGDMYTTVERGYVAIAHFSMKAVPIKRKQKSMLWTLGKEYGTLENSSELSYHPVELTRLLVAGLMGRVPERVRAAAEAFGDNIGLAHAYVTSKKTGRKIYGELRPHLAKLQSGDSDAIGDIIGYFREFIPGGELNGNKNRRKIEALSDILEDIEGAVMDIKPIRRVTARMQLVVPSDLFDDRTLNCCTFYPGGVQRRGSLQYFSDKTVGLLHFIAQQEERPSKKGVAILVLETSKDGQPIMIVDSLEGSSNLRLIKGWNDFAYGMIANVAADIGAQRIIVNDHVGGNTAKEFVRYIASTKETRRGFFPVQGRRLKTSGLESITLLETPTGTTTGVHGYVIELTQPRL